MEQNKIIKILIPVIAIIVVFESIVLVTNLNEKSSNISQENTSPKQEVEVKKETEKPVADFIWQSDNTQMKVGKSYTVSLNFLGNQDLVLDSIETYVYFDPKLVAISNLTTNKAVGEELKPTGIDNKIGLITAILWNDNKGVGYEAKKGESAKVLSFTVTPKVEGNLEFGLSTSTANNKFASIIVETNTAKTLAYSSNKLEINVIK